MELLYKAEIERLAYQEPPSSTTAQAQIELLSTEELNLQYSQKQIARFVAIFDSHQRIGTMTRGQYMDRVELEFRLDGLTRSDFDRLDKYF